MKRRDFIRMTGASGVAALVASRLGTARRLFAHIRGGSLDPSSVTKFVSPLVKPPAFIPSSAPGRAAL